MNDLELYEKTVKFLIESKSTQVISNGVIAHSVILIREMIKNANYNIRIFCNRLNSQVYADSGIIDAIKLALSKEVDINIVIQQSETDEGSSALKKLLGTERIKTVFDCPPLAQQPLNFCIVDDGLMYRLEPDKKRPCAKACMNAKEDQSIQSIIQSFINIWDNIAQPLEN